MRWLFLCMLLVACTRDASSDMPDAAPDAPDGVGCAPLTPRSVRPEAFIGPDGLQARLGTLIDSAQHTLDLQMYLFTVDAVGRRIGGRTVIPRRRITDPACDEGRDEGHC